MIAEVSRNCFTIFNIRHGKFETFLCKIMNSFFGPAIRGVVKNKNGLFTVRLTVRVDRPPLTVSFFYFFWCVFDLFL